MAEKGVKRPREDFREEASGYLHNVEEIKLSQRNNSKYFSCQLQGESTVHRVVCFSPQKHATFANAERLQSPVKLNQIKYSPGKTHVEILVNQKSDLNILPSPLPYKRKLSLPVATPNLPQLIKLNSVQDPKTDLNGSYIINAKVVKMEEEKNVIIFKASKRMRNVIVHDGSNYITVALYENLVDQVEMGKSYSFRNLGLRNYMDTKSMTCKASTEIHEMENEVILPPNFKLEDAVMRQGIISSVLVDSFVMCPCCSSRLQNIEQILLDNTIKIVKCQNAACQMSTRKKTLKYSIKATLEIDFQNCKEKLTLPNSIATDFLESLGKNELLKDSSALENFLLDEDNVVWYYLDWK